MDKKNRGKLDKPSVLGVVFQLNHCLDFTDSAFIEILSQYYHFMKEEFRSIDKKLPINRNHSSDKYQGLIFRDLDCAVIEYIHEETDKKIKSQIEINGFSDLKRFDTTRGVFTEGGPAFEGAGIQSKNHIQICIRNTNCIKGLFIPRNETKFP